MNEISMSKPTRQNRPPNTGKLVSGKTNVSNGGRYAPSESDYNKAADVSAAADHSVRHSDQSVVKFVYSEAVERAFRKHAPQPSQLPSAKVRRIPSFVIEQVPELYQDYVSVRSLLQRNQEHMANLEEWKASDDLNPPSSSVIRASARAASRRTAGIAVKIQTDSGDNRRSSINNQTSSRASNNSNRN